MNPSDTFPAVGIFGSVETPCELKHVILRLSDDPPQFGSSAPPIGRERCHDLDEFTMMLQEGRITALEKECPVLRHDMAFFARPSFLVTYKRVCGEPFPWPSSGPIVVKTLVDPEEEKQSFPTILQDETERLTRENQVLAVLGSPETLVALFEGATQNILDHGRRTGCRYLNHEQDSQPWLDDLDRLKEIGWLATFCSNSIDSDLLIQSYALVCLSFYERGASDLIHNLFETGIHPFAPEITYDKFFDRVRRLKMELSAMHKGRVCRCKKSLNKPVVDQQTDHVNSPLDSSGGIISITDDLRRIDGIISGASKSVQVLAAFPVNQ
ncbi:MAG: hypothetical protein HQL81_15315 [Magnetococcales bacterium]|nr:hypothetical protein [Magnetococcales bacterium]